MGLINLINSARVTSHRDLTGITGAGYTTWISAGLSITWHVSDSTRYINSKVTPSRPRSAPGCQQLTLHDNPTSSGKSAPVSPIFTVCIYSQRKGRIGGGSQLQQQGCNCHRVSCSITPSQHQTDGKEPTF